MSDKRRGGPTSRHQHFRDAKKNAEEVERGGKYNAAAKKLNKNVNTTQTIDMSAKAQDMVLDLLRNMRTDDAPEIEDDFLKKYEEEAAFKIVRNKQAKLEPTPETPQEEVTRKLHSLGFPRELCVEAIQEAGDGRDFETYTALVIKKFLHKCTDFAADADAAAIDESEKEQQISDEQLALEAIFGEENFTVTQHKASESTKWVLKIDTPGVQGESLLEIRFTSYSNYPIDEPPLILYKNLLLSQETKQAIHERIYKFCWTLLGSGAMIYTVADWLQNTLGDFIKSFENPETLLDNNNNNNSNKPSDSYYFHSNMQFMQHEKQQEQERLQKVIQEKESKKTEADARKAFLTKLIQEEQNASPEEKADKYWHENHEHDVVMEEEENKAFTTNAHETETTFFTQKITNEDMTLKKQRIIETEFQTEEYKRMLQARERLPAFKKRQEIIDAIKANQVVVISGETGCGKTTQIPQFIDEMFLEEPGPMGKVICTQPRRLAAISVAQRVSQERGQRLGDSVGYQIRLEHKMSKNTRILFVTTGILLRRMQGDPQLKNITHIIVDEIHERNLDSDFLLIILKDILEKRKDLKVVLMSATLNAEMFSAYFNNCPIIEIPGFTYPVKVHYLEDIVEATQYSLHENSPYANKNKTLWKYQKKYRKMKEEEFLKQHRQQQRDKKNKQQQQDQSATTNGAKDSDANGNKDKDTPTITSKNVHQFMDRIDESKAMKELFPKYSKQTQDALSTIDEDKINYELIERLIDHIDRDYADTPGAILIFMPGLQEITFLYEKLMQNSYLAHSNKFIFYPLHSTISMSNQQDVFKRPPRGVRKVVISTNIAETSITIDDIVFVIDTGRVKENRYDHASKLPCLVETWISRASARQRKGRAGRVQEGICFRMYTKYTHDDIFLEYQVPEMHRAPLENLCLTIKVLDLGKVHEFLEKAIEPPKRKSVQNSVETLQEIGAIRKNAENDLTPLGYHLAALPVDVRLGKMMLYGVLFQCLDPILTICSSLSVRSPFTASIEDREQLDAVRKRFSQDTFSDHMVFVYAYNDWITSQVERTERAFLEKNFLSRTSLQQIQQTKRQFADLLREIGFLPKQCSQRTLESAEQRGPARGMNVAHDKNGIKYYFETGGIEFNVNSINTHCIKAVMCGGLYPNIAKIVTPNPNLRFTGSATSAHSAHIIANKIPVPRFATRTEKDVQIHPTSINNGVKLFDQLYLIYYEMVKTTQVFIRDCSTISPWTILLFSNQIEVRGEERKIMVDGWLEFACDPTVAVLAKQLKGEMDALFLKKTKDASMEIEKEGKILVKAIIQLLASEAASAATAATAAAAQSLR